MKKEDFIKAVWYDNFLNSKGDPKDVIEKSSFYIKKDMVIYFDIRKTTHSYVINGERIESPITSYVVFTVLHNGKETNYATTEELFFNN